MARKEYPSNGFVDGKKSTNLTNARLTLRSRGAFDLPPKAPSDIVKPRKPGEVPMGLQGSRLLLWVRAETQGTTANFALTGNPTVSEGVVEPRSHPPEPALHILSKPKGLQGLPRLLLIEPERTLL